MIGYEKTSDYIKACMAITVKKLKGGPREVKNIESGDFP